jgi:hypothetical protein
MSPANHIQRTPEEQAVRDEEQQSARAQMKALEEGDSVPSDPAEWPTGKAKFLTFGTEGDDAYGDGPTGMLGPAGLELNADGSKSVRGLRPDAPSASGEAAQPGAPAGGEAQASTKRGRFGFGRRVKR